MGVCKGDRKESKVEFDDAYFKIYEDSVRLSLNNFGGKNELLETYAQKYLLYIIWLIWITI